MSFDLKRNLEDYQRVTSVFASYRYGLYNETLYIFIVLDNYITLCFRYYLQIAFKLAISTTPMSNVC